MILEYLSLEGFRRFHEPTILRLSGKLVALVGSNEAGKSSALKAISYFSDERAIEPRDRTYLGTRETKLTLGFYLEGDDLGAANLSRGSWLTVTKGLDGSFDYDVTPPPPRDLVRRQAMKKLGEKALGAKGALSIMEGYADIDLVGTLRALIAGPLDDRAEFDGSVTSTISDIVTALDDMSDEATPKSLVDLREAADAVLTFEGSHDPLQEAVNILADRVPRLLFFGPQDRDLGLPYAMASYRDGQVPSPAFGEILRLAELNISALADADQTNNHAVRTGLMAAANERLRTLSKGVWSQSDATLFLDFNNGQLDLLVEHRDGFDIQDRYNNLKDRSDGYRQFVALQVFAFLQETEGSILLIDEIEQHLHYDAQADLVQLLQKDITVKKVIYSTHSAGALPEDLGNGVRLVTWDDHNRKLSLFKNKFWVRKEEQGFRPLLFGMGATTLAFFPTRRALISEGMTEVLLIPRLLREALEVETLGFQVIGGLANISPQGLPMLDLVNNSICYIVDGDSSGEAISAGLQNVGIPKGKVLSMKSVPGTVTVEDLIEKSAWEQAVRNLAVKFTPEVSASLTSGHFPSSGRIAALPKLLAGRKIEIAYELLDLLRIDPMRPLLANSKKLALKKVGNGIRAQLDIS